MSYEKERAFALSVAHEMGTLIRNGYFADNFVPEHKSDGSPVTILDVAANQLFIQRLHEYFPRDGVVSEELPETSGERLWYVDPLDGTSNLLTRSGCFSTLIGLVVDQHPVLGVVHVPLTGESYCAVRGEGAQYLTPLGHERTLRTKSRPLDHLVLICSQQLPPSELGKVITSSLQPQRTIINNGGAGLSTMKVAEGVADIYVPSKPKAIGLWDLCGPQMILEEAGGCVRYADGKAVNYAGPRQPGKLVLATCDAQLTNTLLERSPGLRIL